MTNALKAKHGRAGFPKAGTGDAANLKIATGTYTLLVNPGVGDTIDFCNLPAGAVVVDGVLFGTQIDTGGGGATFDIDIGWTANGVEGANALGFGDLGVLNGSAVTNVNPETGIKMPLGGVLMTTGPQKFSAETLIQGKVIATANTGGTGTLTLVVYYYIDPSFTV